MSLARIVAFYTSLEYETTSELQKISFIRSPHLAKTPLETLEDNMRQVPDSPNSVSFAMIVFHYALNSSFRAHPVSTNPARLQPSLNKPTYRFLILHHLLRHPHPPRHPFRLNRRPRNIFSAAFSPSNSPPTSHKLAPDHFRKHLLLPLPPYSTHPLINICRARY